MKDTEIKSQKAAITAVFKKKKGKKSYYEIAQKSGLSITQLRSVEQGKQYTVDSLVKLCDALDCKLTITDK